MSLAERGIEGHHQGKARHQAEGGIGLVTVAMGLGVHFMGDHEPGGERRDGPWHDLGLYKVDGGITSTRPLIAHVCKAIAAIEKMASGEHALFCDPAPVTGFVKLLLIFKEK